MAKKSFKDSNPALQFISTAAAPEEETQAHDTQYEHTAHDKPKPTGPRPKGKEETKSKRLNLLLQPSVVVDMGKIAAMKRSSVNDLINAILKDFITQEASTLAKYEEVFGGSED